MIYLPMSFRVTSKDAILNTINTIHSLPIAYLSKADSRFVPNQWETALLCNDVSHWLGANLEAALLSKRSAETIDLAITWPNYLTHCGLVTPYSDRELDQHQLRWWFGAIRHQAITWPDVDPVTHHLNQCWLIISKVQGQSSEGYSANLSQILFEFPRGQWVNIFHIPWPSSVRVRDDTSYLTSPCSIQHMSSTSRQAYLVPQSNMYRQPSSSLLKTGPPRPSFSVENTSLFSYLSSLLHSLALFISKSSACMTLTIV